MKGLATVKMLKEIEKGTGKQIHEIFDLICGTSTGGMLAVALGIKSLTLEKCEEIYKNLGECMNHKQRLHVGKLSSFCVCLLFKQLKQSLPENFFPTWIYLFVLCFFSTE